MALTKVQSEMAGAGQVLQVVSATTTTAFSTTSGTPVDITGLTVTITPKSATSKILIFGRMNIGGGISGSYTPEYYLVRNSTQIGGGTGGTASGLGVNGDNSASSNVFSMDIGFNYLDSPATTSATVYKMQMQSQNSVASYVNRPNARDRVGSSTITVMEISA